LHNIIYLQKLGDQEATSNFNFNLISTLYISLGAIENDLV
jgi:hypothetical protein